MTSCTIFHFGRGDNHRHVDVVYFINRLGCRVLVAFGCCFYGYGSFRDMYLYDILIFLSRIQSSGE